MIIGLIWYVFMTYNLASSVFYDDPDCSIGNVYCVGSGEEFASLGEVIPEIDGGGGNKIYFRDGMYQIDNTMLGMGGSPGSFNEILPFPNSVVIIEDPCTSSGPLINIQSEYWKIWSGNSQGELKFQTCDFSSVHSQSLISVSGNGDMIELGPFVVMDQFSKPNFPLISISGIKTSVHFDRVYFLSSSSLIENRECVAIDSIGYSNGLLRNNIYNVVFDHCQFDGFEHVGISIVDSAFILVDGCYFTARNDIIGKYTVHLTGTLYNISIQNSIFNDNLNQLSSIRIFNDNIASENVGIAIQNNLFNCQSDNDQCIFIDSQFENIHEVHIQNNFFRGGCGNNGAVVKNLHNVSMSRNSIRYNAFSDWNNRMLNPNGIQMEGNMNMTSIDLFSVGAMPLPHFRATGNLIEGKTYHNSPKIDYLNDVRSMSNLNVGPFESVLYCKDYFEISSGCVDCISPLLSKYENCLICQSNSFYWDLNISSICTLPTCYGEFENACNGHGDCVGVDTCVCNLGFTGDQCDENNDPFEVFLDLLLGGWMYFAIGGGFVLLLLVFCIVIIAVILISACIVIKNKIKVDSVKHLLKENELEEAEIEAPKFNMKKELFVIDFKEVELTKLIGSGGSDSQVFEASWKGEKVVVKAFKTSHFDNSHSFEEFEKELEIMSSISHPNVLRFYGCTLEVNKRIGIVMELCKYDLVSFFMNKENKGNIEMLKKLEILNGIASGMNYLHSRKIIHRDLKSKNVLINETQIPKLIDFGLSKIVERMNEDKTKRIGTAHYMAPEIVVSGKYNEKVDVFSYGILLYEVLFENFTPYGKGSSAGIEMKVANDGGFRPRIPDVHNIENEVIDLLKKCWDHSSEVRPSFEKCKDILKKQISKIKEQ